VKLFASRSEGASLADRRPGRVPVVTAMLGSWPGRAVIAGSLVKLASLVVRGFAGSVPAVEVVGSLGTLALLIGLAYYLARLITLARRHLLWRVRRKLIISYLLIGLVPALLIIAFCLLCGFLLFGSVSQYVVSTRVNAAFDQALFLARTAAVELARLEDERDVLELLERKQATLATRYPEASLAVVPVGRGCPTAEPGRSSAFAPARPLSVGTWAHLLPPERLPSWVSCQGFAGLIAYSLPNGGGAAEDSADLTQLTVRAAVFAEGTAPRFGVILDLPVNEATAARLREDTGIELRDVSVGPRGVRPLPARAGARAVRLAAPVTANADAARRYQLPWVTLLDFVDWDTGRSDDVMLSIGMSIGEIYARLQPAQVGQRSFGQTIIMVLVLVAVLFLIIQFVALVFGLALARSITGSVHELFVGTVQVQRGDFSHRIEVKARDQLGELATSFNTMTGRLSSLLAEMAEKKRLEEELRIARDIQMSLLPQGPLRVPGLRMTAHCSPAREVGGDYYDFFRIDERRVGILIADVSGKGTSAALYMAELKGLMLSLSQIHTSPRELMIAANRIIADNLDSRSFITMTYLVLDVGRGTMAYARAGHTPLIHLTGHGLSRRARILTPDGMVLGLNFDRGEKFIAALEEVSVPLEIGDMVALFTDGISEAMNAEEDMFGENRLSTLIEEHADLPFDELRERILREVRDFTGEAGPHDDMTLILLRMEPIGAVVDTPAGAHAAAL
jgi:sigma-B regulation protein RsbU (phosphoserine phosphatase)